MKKLYIFALLMVGIQLTSFGSELKLRVLRNGKHTVSIYNQTQSNNVNYFQFAGLTGNSFLLTVKDQFTNEVIFNNYIQIPEGSTMNAELDGNNNLNIKPANTTNNESNETIGTVNYGNSNTGYYSNNNNNQNGSACSSGNHNGYNHSGQNHNTGHYNWNNNYNNSGYFEQFILNLKNESFDSERLKSAKTYAASNKLSANQINSIATTFTFDSNRLSWAKYAYNKCYDKQNYFLLKNSFDFTSNYDELLDYISNH